MVVSGAMDCGPNALPKEALPLFQDVNSTKPVCAAPERSYALSAAVHFLPLRPLSFELYQPLMPFTSELSHEPPRCMYGMSALVISPRASFSFAKKTGMF